MLYSVYRIDRKIFGENDNIRMENILVWIREHVNQLSDGAKTSTNTELPGCQNYLLVLSMNKTVTKS